MINSVANIIGKFWSILSVIIFMPLYIKYLGEEQYGIISFFTTFQTLLLLMNGGFNTSIKREFAVASDTEQNNRKYLLLKSTEVLFIFLSVFVLCAVSAFSSFIATKWLNIGILDKDYVIQSIDLIGLTIVLQVYSSLYLGCLQGLEHQVASNISQSLLYLVRNVGALIIIKYILADVRLFFLGYIFFELLFIIINRYLVLRYTPHTIKWKIRDFTVLKSILSYTMGVFGVSVISVFNAQLDKVLISKYMSLSDITYYSIATSVGQVPLLLINAVAIAFFPKLVQAITTNNSELTSTLYNRISSFFSIVSISITCFMSVCMYDLIYIWQGKAETSNYTYLPAILLTFAHMFYCLQVTADNCLLAEKNTRILIFKNIGSMVISLLLMIILIPQYGLMGGAVSYLLVSILCWLFYGEYVHKCHTNNNLIKWISKYVILPFVSAGSVALCSYSFFTRIINNRSINVLLMVIIGAITLTLLLFILQKLSNIPMNKE